MGKQKEAKGTKVTLKMAKQALRMMPNGHRRLSLCNMGITVFPKCILKVPNMDELDLSRNLLQKLPDIIGDLPSLQWLDLHSNKLDSLPSAIGKLVGLTHLNLSNNFLTSDGLPSSLGSLKGLTNLNLGLNRLETLPSSLKGLESLQELGLFDNLFSKVPEFLPELHNLTKINMKGNAIPQEESKEIKTTKPEPEEELHLVHESSLCETCLEECIEEREKESELDGRSDMLKDTRIRTFTGLVTPNSVARANEDVWRVRHEERQA